VSDAVSIPAAARRTLEAATARFWRRTWVHPTTGGSRLLSALTNIESWGIVDLETRRARIHTSVGWIDRLPGVSADAAEIVCDGQNQCHRYGERWHRSDTPAGESNPSRTLELLFGADEGRPLGAGEVRGVPVRGFGCIATSPFPPARWMPEPPHRADVWIDDDGLVRRVVWTLWPAVRRRTKAKARMWTVLELWDYGPEAQVELPDVE
jgi:hypothetical protein